MPRERLFPYTRRYAIVQIVILRIRRSITGDQLPRWILPMNLSRGYIIELRKNGRNTLMRRLAKLSLKSPGSAPISAETRWARGADYANDRQA